jgi:RNA polymerase sigma-70 factor (ECF subfamily)
MPAPGDITAILKQWGEDRQSALDRLAPLVYSELHRLAAGYLRRDRPGHTLQPTALVHEAYLKMIEGTMPDWEGRAHFFGIAAHLMRQVLTDSARRFRAQKRHGGERVTLAEQASLSSATAADFLALSQAIDHLEVWDARKAKIIEMKYFGGLTREEIAQTLNLTVATVKRDLSIGEAFLRRDLAHQKQP